MTAALTTYLKQYFELGDLHLSSVAALFEEEQIVKGSYFVKTNAYCRKLSFLDQGLMRIYTHTDTKEVTQWIATPGYFITDLASFVFDSPARWNITALTDCTLYTIKSNAYAKLNEIVPNWPIIEKRFMAKCFVSLEDRVFSHLSLNAEERYNLLFAQNKELFNQVPLQYLASMLGMTPETFSRIRNRKGIS